MFENRILETKFVGDLADNMFSHINGSHYDEDVSFLTTLRILLPSRMRQSDELTYEYKTLNLDEFDDAGHFSSAIKQNAVSNKLLVVSAQFNLVNSNESDMLERFNQISFGEEYHEFEDVRAFFSQKMHCRAFINEQAKSSVVIIFNATVKKYHLAQSIVPKLLPWYFSGQVNQHERTLLRSLLEKTSSSYEAAVTYFASLPDFKNKQMIGAISVYRRKGLINQKARIESKISDINRKIEEYQTYLNGYFRDLVKENMALNGVSASIESNERSAEDFSSFFERNQNVEIASFTGDALHVIVKGYLDIYDAQSYSTLSSNPNSFYWASDYRYDTLFSVKDNRKKVLDAIFSDEPIFKIRTCGVFSLNMESTHVRAPSHYNFPDAYKDYYPNPHLYYNGCLGGYRPAIDRYLASGDITGAISQCIVSVHTVNVHESASFAPLTRDLFFNNKACLIGPDGRAYTAQEAYEYLIDQENNNNK